MGKLRAPDAASVAADVRELNALLGMLGRASERKLTDQAVVLDAGGMAARRDARADPLPPAGSFERFLVDLRVDLGRALGRGDEDRDTAKRARDDVQMPEAGDAEEPPSAGPRPRA
jgi:hypothetical protein